MSGPLDIYDKSNITDTFCLGDSCTRQHHGVDFGLPGVAIGGNIPSLSNGTVSDKGYQSDLGNFIVVQWIVNGINYALTYAHLRDPSPKSVGSSVKTGDVLGNVGATGFTIPSGDAGAHIHVGLQVNGNYTDPLPFIQSSIKLQNAAQSAGSGISNLPIIGGTLSQIPNPVDVGSGIVNGVTGAVGNVADLIKWLMTERHWWDIGFIIAGLLLMGFGFMAYFHKDIEAVGLTAAKAGA